MRIGLAKSCCNERTAFRELRGLHSKGMGLAYKKAFGGRDLRFFVGA
jgi:hypothetical protein